MIGHPRLTQRTGGFFLEAVENAINEAPGVLGAEASARGVEVEDLLAEAASRLARPVTGGEVAAFLADNTLTVGGRLTLTRREVP